MNNFFKKKKGQILIFLLTILLLFSLGFFQKKVENFFYLLLKGPQRVIFRAGDNLSSFFEAFFRSGYLEKQNEELLFENQKLKSEVVFLKGVEGENKILREAFDLGLKDDFDLILSEIILRNPSQDFVLINKGINDGVKPGMAVITSQKILVGKIKEAQESFSEVVLTTNRENSFPVRIQEKEIMAQAKGEGVSQLSLDFIPRDKEVEVKDVVVTTGLETTFPKNLLVGEIESIEESDLTTYKKAKLKPAFDLKDLESLFIVLDY